MEVPFRANFRHLTRILSVQKIASLRRDAPAEIENYEPTANVPVTKTGELNSSLTSSLCGIGHRVDIANIIIVYDVFPERFCVLFFSSDTV